MQTYQVI